MSIVLSSKELVGTVGYLFKRTRLREMHVKMLLTKTFLLIYLNAPTFFQNKNYYLLLLSPINT
jgi:hypothetical protein